MEEQKAGRGEILQIADMTSQDFEADVGSPGIRVKVPKRRVDILEKTLR